MEHMLKSSPVLRMVGLNHRTAPLLVRENLAFSDQDCATALRRMVELYPHSEAAILSTCNRVELYVAAGPHGPTLEQMTAFLADFHHLSAPDLQVHTYQHEDRAMVEHLFQVASSLDSMVLGETQILAQVKRAYQRAAEGKTVRTLFHALFQRALAAAKDVHDRTELSSGRTSLATIAVAMVQRVFDQLGDKTVLVIGAGKISRLVLRQLGALNPRKILLANRTHQRALDLGASVAMEIADLAHLDQLLVEADVVLTGTGSTEPVISAEMVRKLLKTRQYRPMFIVDLAVPRDVEAAVGSLTNIYLYNIDDLENLAEENRRRRGDQIAASLQVIHQHAEEFLHWFSARNAGPLVKQLYANCHRISDTELAGLLAAHPEFTPEQRQALTKTLHRVVGKILHQPVSFLTSKAPSHDQVHLAAAMETLFGLTGQPDGGHSDSHAAAKGAGQTPLPPPEAPSHGQ